MSRTCVGVPVPRQTPCRINLNQYVRQAGVIYDPATQGLFGRFFVAELQHDQERHRPMCSRQFTGGALVPSTWYSFASCRCPAPMI
ncbi:MAG TPA: hypothetical protein VF126_09255 [Acidobacteriaceae bacterium]